VRSLLRRYRELVFVAALLAAPLLVYAVRGRKPAQLNLADRVLVQLTAPAEKLIVYVAGGLVDGFQSYVWLRHVRADNLDLRRRVVRQEQEVISSQEVKAENERLRRLVGFRQRLGDVKPITAEVIAVGASPQSNTLRISRGLRDGVQRGAPVISPDGVVGTVAQLFDGYADVQLVTSQFSAVAAINQRTRGRSTVRGTGNESRAKLEYALRTEEMLEGDMMLSAGGAGQFPKGLRIGRVVDVQKKPYGLFQQAQVLPAVDFARLDEVLVLPMPPEETPAPVDGPALVAGKTARPADPRATPQGSPAPQEVVPATATQNASVVPAVAPLKEGTAP